MPLFTVFIPTYNRAAILRRTLDSISAQHELDLEVVIVDDGSTDNTREIVDLWREQVSFPVVYVYQANQGKNAAHNTMLSHASGELVVLLNSDDLLAEGALATVREEWEKAKQIADCGGIEGLSGDLESGALLGTRFPQDRMLGNYLEMREQYGVRGDKLDIIRADVLREFPFPRFAGEKHVPPSMVWSRIAHRYRLLHINTVLQLKEYRSDGITKGWSDKKSSNPCGYRQFYLDRLNHHISYLRFSKRMSAARRYVYLSLRCGVPLRRQLADIDRKWLFVLAFPFGFAKHIFGRT